MERDKKILLSAVIITVIVFVGIYLIFSPAKCFDYACFQFKMNDCSPVKYVNEEKEASWSYYVVGPTNDECKIRVTLLMAKEGDLGLKELEGHSMNCFYPRGVSAYPDKDLFKCHGTLKEDLQQRIIQKLHEYIVENIGDLRIALTS